MNLYIGLMSGTSMDGIDAVIMNSDNQELVSSLTKPYSNETISEINEFLSKDHHTLHDLKKLDYLIGCDFADATKELLNSSNISSNNIKAIGSHGQTVCHDTKAEYPYTVQLGCGHTIAHQTGITVVNDFRTRDIIAGGEGAPFAPIFHRELFKKSKGDRAIVNVGGITNITFLSNITRGWDLGPGNCLLDLWIKKHLGLAYDNNGEWAGSGKSIKALLDKLLDDIFLKQQPPKSIGKEYFSLDWLNHYIRQYEYKPEDIQATLIDLTATCIADAVLSEHPINIKELYICGGGSHNKILMNTISDKLPKISVKSTVSIGIDPDYIEAMIFAWMASKTLNQIPLNLYDITGSSGDILLGSVHLSGNSG